ncbi:MAG: hypothetical protein HY363_00405 [Candidatus Aenigmarchaeota archaeon]|nr:hypothetical protein [Candidatus Aenigmarchaeota archaeon]
MNWTHSEQQKMEANGWTFVARILKEDISKCLNTYSAALVPVCIEPVYDCEGRKVDDFRAVYVLGERKR